MAGFYLITDKRKLGGCGEPYNLEDIEDRLLMIRDAVLDSRCQLLHDPIDAHNKNLFGDINTINGVPFPEMPLQPKTYRFRIINTAVSRPWLLKIKNALGVDVHQSICHVIAADGGYRSPSLPWPAEGLQLGVAERYEVVCDFSSFKGQKLYLWNGRNGRMFKDVPYFCHSHLMSLLNVAATLPRGTLPPAKFVPTSLPPPPMHMEKILSPVDLAVAQQMITADTPHRRFDFGRTNGHWTINGQTWDTMKIAADDVGQNTWELWKIKTGGGWFHPVHVHLVDFFIMQRGNNPDEPAVINPVEQQNTDLDGLFAYERNAPKDVLFLGPSQVMWVIARYGAHRGDYMFHCHNLVHEDNDMLRAFDMVGGTGVDSNTAHKDAMNAQYSLGINTAAAQIYNGNHFNSAMDPASAAKPTAQWPAYDRTYMQSYVDQNVYKIFYPTTDDDEALLADNNPWKSEVCQSLPVV